MDATERNNAEAAFARGYTACAAHILAHGGIDLQDEDFDGVLGLDGDPNAVNGASEAYYRIMRMLEPENLHSYWVA